MKVWTWLKNGEPKGFFKDEHSLLLSYDMMPLMGLENMKEALNKEGRIATGELVEDAESSFFVPFKESEPDIGAIDWGCHSEDYGRCLQSLAFYISFMPSEPKRNKFGISDEQNMILREFTWRYFLDDKRRRRSLPKLQGQAEQIVAIIGFKIKPVQFVV